MMTDSIDLSWMTDIQKQPTYFLKESVLYLDIIFIYVDKTNHIEKITIESKPVINNIIEKESLIGLIQKLRQPTPTKRYKLIDVMSFFVDIDPSRISEFTLSSSEIDSSKWMKTIPIIDDIIVEPTLSLFQGINSIFVVLQEMIPVKKPALNKTPLHSILKSQNTVDSNNKKTKRVRISPDVIERSSNSKKTAKSREVPR
jgi:hypothetical protein